MLPRRDLDFLLYELLGADALATRPRHEGQGREIYDAVLDTAEGVAREYYAPNRKANDQQEPEIRDGKVVLQPGVKPAWNATADAGIIAATHDESRGGLQLPHVIASAAIAHLEAANIGTASYPMLTAGASNLLAAFVSEEQLARWLPPLLTGRFSGTMALTEPDAGSSLADLRTKAIPQPDGSYRIEGTKIWISGGEHELTENIVHLVLARIEGAPAGTKGISLFIVPRKLVGPDGSAGADNHVTLGGLIHKMGWRGTTSTLLNFGERGACVGELLGKPHHGLAYMFHMMNEARIGVGRAATAMGYAAFRSALDYAQQRRQGRVPGEKDPSKPPVAIIEHADVRRMLLVAKTAAEGSLHLVLYCARLVDEQQTVADDAARTRATRLLEALTPIAKTWPSVYCQEGISAAVQVMGGYGYAREYDVEQLYRDNRLNQIHEGTNGIQALDLLGRKVTQDQGACFHALLEDLQRMASGATSAALAPLAAQLQEAAKRMTSVTQSLVRAIQSEPARGLANATAYLELVSRVVYAGLWLEQATVAERALASGAGLSDVAFYEGKLQAAKFYFGFELPKHEADAALLLRNDPAAFEMRTEWF
ncbi:MAG: acyl-CoA dehydrogenase [Gemmatimonadaceae bacterium]|nr:acyl-CoA dehydrogenase [Gemmatimonadaceae bacterium]MCW5826042.1 acyl-CoA dehydrogenase [Gemmatimonadaceae bacterium]